MKKEDLKKMLKPLVKECMQEAIHEILFDSGVVTRVVAEVIKGVNIPQLVESMAPKAVPLPVDMVTIQAPLREVSTQMAEVVGAASRVAPSHSQMEQELRRHREEHVMELNESRTRLEESIGGSLGIKVFENLAPIPVETNGQGALSDIEPGDPGINLANIPGLKTLNFSGHIK